MQRFTDKVLHFPLRKSAFTQNVKEGWNRVIKSTDEIKNAFLAAGGDWNANIPDEIYQGMKVELEHTDVTGGDLVQTAKIVIAHLNEDRKYYSKLETMEKAQAMRIRSGIFHSQNV